MVTKCTGREMFLFLNLQKKSNGHTKTDIYTYLGVQLALYVLYLQSRLLLLHTATREDSAKTTGTWSQLAMYVFKSIHNRPGRLGFCIPIGQRVKDSGLAVTSTKMSITLFIKYYKVYICER